MLTTVFATLATACNVVFSLDLFGVSVGNWLTGFLIFDGLVGVVVFTSKQTMSGSSGVNPPKRVKKAE